jgi:hypothetical protein
MRPPVPGHRLGPPLLLAMLVSQEVLAEEGVLARMRPGHVDLRVEGAASVLPLSLEAGAAVEVGVLPVATGTLSVGAEVGGTLCALACWVPNLLSERQTSRWELSALGRLGYHFALANPNKREADLFGFLLGGVTAPRTTVTTPTYRFEGLGRGPVLGAGFGVNYFLAHRVYLGGEARLRMSFGDQTLTLTRGTHDFTDDERQWLRFGLSTTFFAGLRLF